MVGNPSAKFQVGQLLYNSNTQEEDGLIKSILIEDGISATNFGCRRNPIHGNWDTGLHIGLNPN
jgi:hypothetical protein